ncbi:MAG: hypothetical protein AB7E79_05185 [Rhodospirillaceae bacterium]
MIVSFTRQFIFVHVVKTAGMSMEKSLWPHDVRASLIDRPPRERAALLESIGISPAIFSLDRHATAAELRSALGADVFRRMFKFAFVCNPWDLELSLYHFNLEHPEFPGHQRAIKARNFEDYLLNSNGSRAANGVQRRFVADEDGKIIVDFIGRFETLAQDFAKVCSHVGIEVPLGHHNRSQHLPWPRCYTREMFEFVRRRAEVDIDTFGYAADPDLYGVQDRAAAGTGP